jgi:hypothetical protein
VNVFAELENKLAAIVRDAVREAEDNAAPIEAAVTDVLHEAGVPPEIASLFGELFKFLRDHFQAEHAPAQPEPAPEPQPDPGVPGA